MAVKSFLPWISAVITYASGAMFDPYFANLSWVAPRTLSTWDNLTVSTPTGTFIGMLPILLGRARGRKLTCPVKAACRRPSMATAADTEEDWKENRLDIFRTRWVNARIMDQPRLTWVIPACPQFVSGSSSLWNMYQPPNPVINIGEPSNAGAIAWSSAEDCLSLAIWTPSYANETSKLPVALFVTGGGGVTGGINIASQLPTNWVSRSQEHIVVTINYRVNIFGNPKSRALNETSLTLLDIRAAVEWVSANIELFGGDKDNILLWGQSQGAAFTHMYTLAWPEDPLVNKFGIISQPPSVQINLTVTPDPYADFSNVAAALGCNYGNDSEAELECMRHISFVQIIETINNWNSTPSVAFNAYIPDERYIFSNETDRYVQGKVARGPAIKSNAATEIPTDGNLTASISSAKAWTCANYQDSVLRQTIGLDTYRYFWGGNFSNISPVPWLGAFHWSDLFMFFGTYMLDVGEVSQLEVETSETMQDYLLAFTKNAGTVETTVGWPEFDVNSTDGGAILEFGKDLPVKNITGDYVDGSCWDSSAEYPYHG
ncbi:putative Carboxylesterase type B domain-containing protein [Seiridium cardinale]|uniref:Carboxylesterase type B domain-containing protein n=1 Tax=Seiridium cardinale TaxID=138064 RepID=A0ABR2XFK6_9PEZI